MDIMKNNKIDLYIDVGNNQIKIGFVNDNKWYIKKIKTNAINQPLLDGIFNKLEINHVYIGSVVLFATNYLKQYFELKNIKYSQITNQMFKDKLILNPSIDINEVGTDILAFCFLVKDFKNTLCLNFGTATVAFIYDELLKGVMIGPNFIHSYDYLQDILKQEFDISYVKGFGTNTFQAINSSRTYLLNGFINEILDKNPNINQIICTGGDKNILSIYINTKKIKIIDINEAVIKGYYAIINQK